MTFGRVCLRGDPLFLADAVRLRRGWRAIAHRRLGQLVACRFAGEGRVFLLGRPERFEDALRAERERLCARINLLDREIKRAAPNRGIVWRRLYGIAQERYALNT